MGLLKHASDTSGLFFLCELWEHEYRPPFASAHGRETDDEKYDLLGDLRNLRNDVVRHRGIATSGNSGRCVLLRHWFQPGDVIRLEGSCDVSAYPRTMRNIRCMTGPTPYLHFPGTAREALTFYGEVFGCAVQLHTFAEFNRTDGPADAVAHGYLAEGPVALFGADVSGDEPPFRSEGMMLSLLGTAAPSTLHNWFSRLADGGQVVDDLQTRQWGASDGQVIDRYGLHWLIGFEGD